MFWESRAQEENHILLAPVSVRARLSGRLSARLPLCRHQIQEFKADFKWQTNHLLTEGHFGDSPLIRPGFSISNMDPGQRRTLGPISGLRRHPGRDPPPQGARIDPAVLPHRPTPHDRRLEDQGHAVLPALGAFLHSSGGRRRRRGGPLGRGPLESRTCARPLWRVRWPSSSR